MQRLFYFFLAGIFLLTSCQQEDWLPGDHLHPESSKIDAARLYFEDAISRAASSGITMKNNTWSPGEITPEWKNAIYKKSGQYEFLFIPVLAQNHYLAEERIARKSGMEYYRVRVSQFLAIRRNTGGDYSMVCFSLIPSKEYYRDNKNKVVEKFLESSSYYGDFTGRIVYHSVAGGTLMGVEKVGNGVFEWGFWKEEDTGPEEIRANFQKMFENISVFQVISTRGPIYDGGMLEEAECIYCQKCHKQVEPGHVCSSQEEQKEDSPEGNVSGGDKGAGESWVGGSTGGTGSTGGGGGGGGIIGGGGEIILRNIDLTDKNKFISFSTYNNCMSSCKDIMKNYNVPPGSSAHVYQLLFERNGVLEYYDRTNYRTIYQNAINCIDRHLNADRPIVVGVNHTIGRAINEGTTDHWIVVTGREYDEKLSQYYYIYIETGRNDAEKGCNTTANRLYYDEKNYTFKDKDGGNKHLIYDVTQVRPNDGKNLNETTPQPAKP